jgi:hypothetical protein
MNLGGTTTVEFVEHPKRSDMTVGHWENRGGTRHGTSSKTARVDWLIRRETSRSGCWLETMKFAWIREVACR